MSDEPLRRGFVSLVGAGPGDPGLLTRKGEQRIREADVVIHDALVSPPIVRLAGPSARVVHRQEVGDGKQEAINDFLVEQGLAGKRVVRLKGGDPFVFGRGAEEAEVLVEAGIPFEVVPGVSSGIGVPAYAGIPLSHRSLVSNVTFVTGHEDPSKEGSFIDWDRLVRTGGTLVVFMGVRRMARVVEKLVEMGASPSTPVAVIQWGTTPMQRTVVGDLVTIVGRVQRAGLDHPALVVIGQVVKQREKLSWFDQRPLWGRRVLVTRAASQAPPLISGLRDAGAGVVTLPMLEFGPPTDPSSLERVLGEFQDGVRYDWVVFTSANGVTRFWDALADRGMDLRAFAGAKIACVGPATAQALKDRAIVADLVPANYRAEGLLSALTQRNDTRGKRVLLPRAEIARNVLPDALRKHGAKVDTACVYSTRRPEHTHESAVQHVAAVDTVTFTSPSSVRHLVELLGQEADQLLSDRVLAAIGPVTARAIEAAGLKADVVADSSTSLGLVDALVAASTNTL